MRSALSEAAAAAPHLAPYITSAGALMSGDVLAKAEALERLAKLARETVRRHPLASAALMRAIRELATELSGVLLETAMREPDAVQNMLHGEDLAR